MKKQYYSSLLLWHQQECLCAFRVKTQLRSLQIYRQPLRNQKELRGISKEDLGIEDDEMLPIVAMSLLDYQKTMSPTSRTTAGGCVLEALGVREVVNSAGKGAAKYITKAVAKAVVKKAIPYIGWGWFAWDYIACVTE